MSSCRILSDELRLIARVSDPSQAAKLQRLCKLARSLISPRDIAYCAALKLWRKYQHAALSGMYIRYPLISTSPNIPLRISEILITMGASLTSEGLSRAASHGHDAVVRRLLQAGADIHTSSESPIRCAVENGHTTVVKTLLDHGADVNVYEGAMLCLAADEGHVGVVKVLLEAGDVDMLDQAMCAAAQKGHVEVVRVLLKAGADPAQDGLPIARAAGGGHAEVIRILIKANADPRPYLPRALNCASKHGHDAVVKLVIQAGVEIHYWGEHAVLLAVSAGHDHVARTLLRAGAGIPVGFESSIKYLLGEENHKKRDSRYGCGPELEGLPTLLAPGATGSLIPDF
ncbi:hypothetical protein HK097_004776 [Rhizophlyctis rosea]|uniref:Uncharacterized protein n=1 Tax=Rhizophlyctis rosea TaxID=64517 RepID=A0AAD5SFA9_9FUNG|nr:hypothetical protein HK097_004776 [Rhizophlyctis rosea]